MKVKDVMHKGVDWVSPDTPVTELAKLMREHDIGAIPIGENDRLIGMVTDRDIVCKGLAQDSFDAGRATASAERCEAIIPPGARYRQTPAAHGEAREPMSGKYGIECGNAALC